MKIAITGANGLLGRAVVDEVETRGHEPVTMDKEVDVRDQAALADALQGVDAVIHTASLIDLHLGRPKQLYDVNVTGAHNLIAACRQNNITRLVHMSSAEVISGADPIRGLTESEATYPTPHLTYYGETKQQGEQAVLKAADDTLGTCAMRTYGLFGVGDNTVVPSYLSRLVANRVIALGDETGRTDTIFAPNLAHALVLAAERLEPGVDWSGTAFHVTDAEPVVMQQFLFELTEHLGVRRVRWPTRIPSAVVGVMARACELPFRLTKADRFAYPRLTAHSALLATGDYWLDSTKLRTVLGYEPPTARADAIRLTQDWLRATYGA